MRYMWNRNPYQDEFFDKIERLGKKNHRPFNAWFEGQERVYFPFDPEHILGFHEDDEEVIEALEEADFEVHDYKGGYCRREGSSKSIRIGKVLNRLRKKDLLEAKEKHEKGQIHNLRREVRDINKYHDKLLKYFSSSNYRNASEIAEFSVVISQNPHDIAKMSTNRKWESCMTLGTGGMHSSVFKEVESGGLIAYLIRSDDVDILQPLSRIHIRRFDGVPGRGATLSIAKTESSVYGEDVEGFKEAVDDWIDSHQGKIQGGVYHLTGGSYSDSFKHDLQIGGSWDLPREPDALLEVYYGRGLEDVPYMTWEVTSNIPWRTEDDEEEETVTFLSGSDAQDYIDDHHLSQYDDWREEDDQYHIEENGEAFWTLVDEHEEFVNEPFTIEEKLVDNRPDLQAQAAAKIVNAKKGIFSPEVIRDVKNNYPALRNSLIVKYPELFIGEEGMSRYDLVKFIKALPREQQGPHIQQTVIKMEEFVNDPASFLPPCLVCQRPINPAIEPTFRCEVVPILHHTSCPEVCDLMKRADALKYGDRKNQHSDYIWASSGRINDTLDLYLEFRTRNFANPVLPVPENIIQKLVTVSERVYLIGQPSLRLQSQILHVLSMTGSDTPTVQRFYESLLPFWRYEFQDLTEKEKKRPEFMRKDRVIYMDNLGSALARLGENGTAFLPFIKSRLDQIHSDFGPQAFDPNVETIPDTFTPSDVFSFRDKVGAWEHVLRITERYLYILDSIESGKGRSQKYRFSWGNV